MTVLTSSFVMVARVVLMVVAFLNKAFSVDDLNPNKMSDDAIVGCSFFNPNARNDAIIISQGPNLRSSTSS